ncbi:chitin synthase-domain-containing protein [Zopfochytrium polystomum]|nr:chitin synthase-domain-containing protein [Zopfochytrium polystomum]
MPMRNGPKPQINSFLADDSRVEVDESMLEDDAPQNNRQHSQSFPLRTFGRGTERPNASTQSSGTSFFTLSSLWRRGGVPEQSHQPHGQATASFSEENYPTIKQPKAPLSNTRQTANGPWLTAMQADINRRRRPIAPERLQQRSLLRRRIQDATVSEIQQSSLPLIRKSDVNGSDGFDWWHFTSIGLTSFLCNCVFTRMKMESEEVKQAFREKLASCIIIAMLMVLVGFETFGIQLAWCPDGGVSRSEDAALNQTDGVSIAYRDGIVIFGSIYDFDDVSMLLSRNGGITLTPDWHGADISQLFETPASACSPFPNPPQHACTVRSRYPGVPALALPSQACLPIALIESLKPRGRTFFTWADISRNTAPPNTLTVFNSVVINLTDYFNTPADARFTSGTAEAEIVARSVGVDATRIFSNTWTRLAVVKCLQQNYMVGYVDKETVGCSATRIIQTFCLIVILILIIVRFCMAVTFHWFMSEYAIRPRQGNRHTRLPPGNEPIGRGSLAVPCPYRLQPGSKDFKVELGDGTMNPAYKLWVEPPPAGQRIATVEDPFCILLVTCYSESEDGIRGTLESLSSTNYPDTHKLLFVIADGLITGAGNTLSTPDAIIKMIDMHPMLNDSHDRKSYLAIADGRKTHNQAKVYGGYFHCKTGGSIPIIAVVKCGTEEEELSSNRSGNRGKRDSQLEGQPMTPLDFEIARQVRIISGVNADAYEVVLMVDADTIVAKDSLQYMILALLNDEKLMGLCVFEYFISHHLGKAFESFFGGVTCLPGCFCMYRIKGRVVDHNNRKWLVPLLGSEDIIREYSISQVDTLHKKNLFCLGEDRFLTTLMLSQFPKRKLSFVPKALCYTTVPSDFKTLLSQRRRWINSTIHNLLELVFMKNLCGIFCFSMQFVVVLELIGTVVLPAAITFMFVLLIAVMINPAASAVPLLTLVAVLGLPGVLILLTSRELEFIGALPVWNFVLPLYAFWHLDDVSWGATRVVAGEGAGAAHGGNDGDYEAGAVTRKSYAQWELDRLRLLNNEQPRPWLGMTVRAHLDSCIVTPSVSISDPSIESGMYDYGRLGRVWQQPTTSVYQVEQSSWNRGEAPAMDLRPQADASGVSTNSNVPKFESTMEANSFFVDMDANADESLLGGVGMRSTANVNCSLVPEFSTVSRLPSPSQQSLPWNQPPPNASKRIDQSFMSASVFVPVHSSDSSIQDKSIFTQSGSPNASDRQSGSPNASERPSGSPNASSSLAVQSAVDNHSIFLDVHRPPPSTMAMVDHSKSQIFHAMDQVSSSPPNASTISVEPTQAIEVQSDVTRNQIGQSVSSSGWDDESEGPRCTSTPISWSPKQTGAGLSKPSVSKLATTAPPPTHAYSVELDDFGPVDASFVPVTAEATFSTAAEQNDDDSIVKVGIRVPAAPPRGRARQPVPPRRSTALNPHTAAPVKSAPAPNNKSVKEAQNPASTTRPTQSSLKLAADRPLANGPRTSPVLPAPPHTPADVRSNPLAGSWRMGRDLMGNLSQSIPSDRPLADTSLTPSAFEGGLAGPAELNAARSKSRGPRPNPFPAKKF